MLSIQQTALNVLHPASDMPESLDATDDGDTVTIAQLQDVLGNFFAEKLHGDKGWALGILGSIKQQS